MCKVLPNNTQYILAWITISKNLCYILTYKPRFAVDIQCPYLSKLRIVEGLMISNYPFS